MTTWPGSWRDLPSDEAANLTERFLIESRAGLDARYLDAMAIARDGASDDVLLKLPDGKVIEAHLSWKDMQPHVTEFPTLDAWLSEPREF